MKELLRTVVAGAGVVGLTGTASAVVAGLSFVGERTADPTLFLWADAVLRVSGVKSACRGLEHLPEGNFVLAVNHQSNFDAMVLFRHIHRHMRFVAKRQLRKVPVFGYALERAGNVFVDRTGGEGDKQRLKEAAAHVRNRVSVVFFAEGTRSDDGVLRPFKKGAAIMALEAQVPLVPAALAGTHAILPKGTIAIRPRPAALVIGKPLETKGLGVEARESLTLEAHASVAKLLDEANAMLPGIDAS